MPNPLTTTNEFRLVGGPYDGSNIKPTKNRPTLVYAHGHSGWVPYIYEDGVYKWAPGFETDYAFARSK